MLKNKRKFDEIYDNNKPINIFCNLNTMEDIKDIENYTNKLIIENDKKIQFENKYNISYELNYF